jgi:hypothetical protein
VRSGNNGLLLGAMQSPSITSASLELALITAMYSCNADSSELLLMAGKVLFLISGVEFGPRFTFHQALTLAA